MGKDKYTAKQLANLIGEGRCPKVVEIYQQGDVNPDDPHALYQSYLAHTMAGMPEAAEAIRALLPSDMMHDASRDELLATLRQGNCDDETFEKAHELLKQVDALNLDIGRRAVANMTLARLWRVHALAGDELAGSSIAEARNHITEAKGLAGQCDDPVWRQNIAFWHLLITSTRKSGGFKIDGSRLDSWRTARNIPQTKKQLAATACLLLPVGYTKLTSQYR